MFEGVKLEGDGMFTTKKVALGRNFSMPEILHRRKPHGGAVLPPVTAFPCRMRLFTFVTISFSKKERNIRFFPALPRF